MWAKRGSFRGRSLASAVVLRSAGVPILRVYTLPLKLLLDVVFYLTCPSLRLSVLLLHGNCCFSAGDGQAPQRPPDDAGGSAREAGRCASLHHKLT